MSNKDQTEQENWDWQELRRVVAELIGQDPKTWPHHGNVPLAIAAVVASQRNDIAAVSEMGTALAAIVISAEEILAQAHGVSR